MRSEQVYEVFARYDPGEPVHHIGSVSATGAREAGVFAYSLYDEWRWRELFVCPRAKLVNLIRPEGAPPDRRAASLAPGPFLLFGRSEYTQPLQLVGPWTLESARSGQEAREEILGRFGREWLELVLVPEGQSHWVLRPPEEAEEAPLQEARP